MSAKTGGGGGPWVEFDSPKPPAVDDHYKYWADAPPELSPRCKWWIRQIVRGWRPNRRWSSECYDCSAELYGIYIWEFCEVICVLLGNGRFGDYTPPPEEPIQIGPQTIQDWLKSELLLEMDKELRRQILGGDGS